MGSRLVCDVTELKPVAGDLDRLENGVEGPGSQGFGNAEGLGAVGRAAVRRDFKNDALMKRAAELEAEAFRIETAMKRLGVDAPEEWLAMAKDARRRKVPEPEPSAHWPTAPSAPSSPATPDVAELQDDHPGNRGSSSPTPRAIATRPARRLRGGRQHYAEDPAAAYREAPENRAQGLRPPAVGRCQRAA